MEMRCSWDRGDTVALAISGGVDSMVLYHLLKTSYRDTFGRLILLHVNHGQRAASEAEEAHIVNMAATDDVLCETVRLDIEKADFSQAAARKARYRFFDEMMARHGARVLLTAHHLDDQYESVMHQLLTGRYLPGKMGIPYTRNEGSYRIIRPLLHVPRTAIEDYAGRHRVIYFEDETNSGTGYTRNYIRHNLMKDIRASEHLQPEQLLKLSEDLGEVDDMLREEAAGFISGRQVLPRKEFNKRRRISRIYIVNAWLASRGLGARRRYIEEMLDVASSGTAQVEFPVGDRLVVIAYDEMRIEAESSVTLHRLDITGNGTYNFNGYEITVEMDTSELPLRVRTREEGDRIFVPGIGTKKLSRLFIDQKVPRDERDTMPVVTGQDHQIIAVGTIYNIMKTRGNHSRLRVEKGVKQ
ncbi:MAG TPA: tRNA lysidine(34) synthetase TilS [Candidatus Salinicoccus stercoripullorum]|uniref:tRNA(Ile)-lysidine synthase n=1 Tax=Candidatus Salinicoccus stercoripullorum TaxID=2838756 RepID=A0A9D1U050_9STAP|nr:tRNA lysidine(34) synthetase TilS [Candidatus Salinicoccus stercoripullorum]